jgi:hypothetical protein
MEVAVVERLEAIDAAPLRQRLVARPSVDVPAVSHVSILTAVQGDSP